MKKLIVVIAIVVAGLVAYNYATTGKFAVLPSVNLSEEDRTLQGLEDRFDAAKKQYSQAARTAGMSGLDTTADADAALHSVQQIAKELRSVRQRLSSEASIRRAESLAASIDGFSSQLR